MREEMRNALIAGIIGTIVMIFIMLLVLSLTGRNIDREDVCKNIGNKLDLDFYLQERGRCGWGIECGYQCKFISQNGGIVIKNIP